MILSFVVTTLSSLYSVPVYFYFQSSTECLRCLVRPVHSETLIFFRPWQSLGILQLIVLSVAFSNYILYRCRLLFNRTICRTPVQIFRGFVLMYMCVLCVCMCVYVVLSFTSTLPTNHNYFRFLELLFFIFLLTGIVAPYTTILKVPLGRNAGQFILFVAFFFVLKIQHCLCPW